MDNFKPTKEQEQKLRIMSTGQYIYDIARTDKDQILNIISLVGPLGYFNNTWIGELYILIALGDIIKFHKRLLDFIKEVNVTKTTISRLRLVLLDTASTELDHKAAKFSLPIYNEQLYNLIK